jgi:hypothetical protein
MGGERYYKVKRVENRFLIDAYNISIVKQVGENLKMFSRNVRTPEEIGVVIEDGKASCIDRKFKLKEITERKALKIINYLEVSYRCWQDHTLTPEDVGSSHLADSGGNILL